jgi:hypothetical protein
MARAAVFDETYAGYLAQLKRLDLGALQGVLGYETNEGNACIPLFDRLMHVSAGAIADGKGRAVDLSVSVVLCRYLLMAPDSIPESGALMTFKDFQDAAPLIHFFANSVEGQIARFFSGRVAALEAACRQMGGHPYIADLAYQIKYRFAGLPRVPLILLFNDAEEGFAAQCTLLFQDSARHYLDMESLAMLGGLLAHRLQQLAPVPGGANPDDILPG